MTCRIPVSKPSVTALECEYVQSALAAGQLSPGPFVERFEAEFSRYVGGEYAVACCSGTAALRLAVQVCFRGFGPVRVPALTFAATAAAVVQASGPAALLLDDVDAVTWCLPGGTQYCGVGVSLYGHRCDEQVVADNAECFGRDVHGEAVVSCYSMYGNKTIATGVGGVVVTNNPGTADEIRQLASHGVDPGQGRFCQVVPGWSVRMGELQAAVGLAQLQRADELLAQRRQVAAWYRQRIDVAHPLADCQQPWLVSVLLDNRDEVARRMAEAGIETRPAFPCVADLPPYRDCPRHGDLPVARDIARRGLSLPLWPGMAEDDVGAVCAALEQSK